MNEAAIGMSASNGSAESTVANHTSEAEAHDANQVPLRPTSFSPDSARTTDNSFSGSPVTGCGWEGAHLHVANATANTNANASANAARGICEDADADGVGDAELSNGEAKGSCEQARQSMSASTPEVVVEGRQAVPPSGARLSASQLAGTHRTAGTTHVGGQSGVHGGAKAAYGNMNAANIHESLLESIQNEIYACRRALIETKQLRMWTVNSATVPTEDEGGITIAASAAAAYAAATAAAVVSSVRNKNNVASPTLTPSESAFTNCASSTKSASDAMTMQSSPSSVAISSTQADKRNSTLVTSPSQTLSGSPPQATSELSTTRSTLHPFAAANPKDALSGVSDAVSFGMLRSSYWSFSKRPLRRTLLNVDDPKFESQALQMFDAVLQHSGVRAHVGGSAVMMHAQTAKDTDRYELVQLLIQRCQADEQICNEFYLQLIKQTTDNPEHGGAVSINNWHLLAVICGIVPPSNTLIGKYLDAHLRKMCIVKAYPDESKAAQKALKYFTLANSKPRRKCPPSCKEIIAVASRKPVYENVYLLDGRKVAVELVPHLTAEQVCAQVKTQISMRQSAKGLALFETCNNYERAVNANTYLCDSLFIWEQSAKKRRAVREVRYVFKKKLFIEPIINVEDAAECDLVYKQLVSDVFACRIPVSKDNLVILCALIAQTEYGDAKSVTHVNGNGNGNGTAAQNQSETTADRTCDYLSSMRIVPRDMRDQVSVEAIESCHKTLDLISAQEAKLKSIEILKEWPLFGCKLFVVTQENSIFTRTFYMAVNKAGVHFLQTASNTTVTPMQTPFASYAFDQILTCLPGPEWLIFTVRAQNRQIEKNSFRTSYAYQIVDLIEDYINHIRETRERSRNNSSKKLPKRAGSERNKRSTTSSKATTVST